MGDTNCGNVIKKYRLDTSVMEVDCVMNAGKTVNSCNINCLDEEKAPTLEKIRCLRKSVRSKKWKFAPKKAKVLCKLPVKGKKGGTQINPSEPYDPITFIF